jgi:dihydroorotate dehydrogenase
MAANPLRFTVGPSAGFVKTKEDAEKALKTGASIIVLGSYTFDGRDGNKGPRLYADMAQYPHLLGSLNSYGLNNPGIGYLRSWLPDFAKKARDQGVRVRVSVAAFSVEEYLKCVRALREFYDGEIELNLGCPNVWHGATQHRIMSFDLDAMQQVLALCRAMTDPRELAVKLSPYSDPWMIGQVWDILTGCTIGTIVTMNTFANALLFDEEGKPAIDVPNGFAGYAGDGALPMGTGQVRQFDLLRAKVRERKAPGSDMRIEGVGGVSSGEGARQMHLAGADGVLSGTAYGKDPRVIAHIHQGMPESLQNLALAA